MAGLDSQENAMWRDKARKIANDVIRPLSKKYDDLQEYPWEIRDALAEAGLMKVWIPKEFGGEAGETPVLDLCIVVEEIARADPAVGVLFAVNALGSFPIIVGGTDEQKARLLPQIAKGEKLVAFCLSEKGAGSDAQGLRVRGVESADGKWKIHGEKKWTTNGGAADIYTVFAVTDPTSRSRRISAFIVEKGMEGFSIGKIEDKMGIRAVPVVETVFDGVEVGVENLLGGKPGLGFKHAMMTLDRARPGVAAQGMGCAQGRLGSCHCLLATPAPIRQGDLELPDGAKDVGRHGNENRSCASTGLRLRPFHRHWLAQHHEDRGYGETLCD